MEQLDLFGELTVQIREGEKTRVCTKCNIEKPLPMFREQTKCDCCGKESETPLHLDHDHETGKFRGWLCIKCNQGIGKLGDNIEGVTNALNFLKKHYEK